jgi:hypothetical protein
LEDTYHFEKLLLNSMFDEYGGVRSKRCGAGVGLVVPNILCKRLSRWNWSSKVQIMNTQALFTDLCARDIEKLKTVLGAL